MSNQSSIPLSERSHFPPLMAPADHEAVNRMVADITHTLADQYGLHLHLGAELEYSVGPISSIKRTLRDDRMANALLAYDNLLLGPDAIFDYRGAVSQYHNPDGTFRQILFAPYGQASGNLRQEFEELVTKKRGEIRARLGEQIARLEKGQIAPEALANDWLDELTLMAQTMTHRVRFTADINAFRHLRQALSAAGDGPFDAQTVMAIRNSIPLSHDHALTLLLTLLVDPNEAVVQPKDNPVYTNYPEEAELLFTTVPKDRDLFIRAFFTGDPAYYAQIRERHGNIDDEEIAQKACMLIRAKMRDRDAVKETFDHIAPVIRRTRLFKQDLDQLMAFVLESDPAAELPEVIRHNVLYGNHLAEVAFDQRLVSLAEQLAEGLGLQLTCIDNASDPDQVSRYLQRIITALNGQDDVRMVSEDHRANLQQTLADHLRAMADNVDRWTVAALAQRERAWRQSDIRRLPEYRKSLTAVTTWLENSGLGEAQQQDVWTAILRNAEAFRVRRTYGYGSMLDKKGVLSGELLETLNRYGVTLNNETRDHVRQFIATCSYAMADLMVRDLKTAVETVYGRVKEVLRGIDPAYAESLPEEALWNIHVEGSGPEFAREIVTAPMPAEIVRIVTGTIRNLLSGELGDSIAFTDPQGTTHPIATNDLSPLGEQYPELFFNGYSGAWTVRNGQHLHYSPKMRDAGGRFTVTPFHHTRDGKEEPTDLAYYTHLALLKLGPSFRAALGSSPDALERWLTGLASPDQFRAMYLPVEYPKYHQITRAAGDTIKLFDDHAEIRAAAMNADTRFLYTFVAIAHQHGADHYVLDQLAAQASVPITADNLGQVVTQAAQNPQAFADDLLMVQFFRQLPEARAAWLERVGRHLERGIIQQGELAAILERTRQNPDLILDDGRISILAYEATNKLRAGKPAGPPIVTEEDTRLLQNNRADIVEQNWRKTMMQALRDHLPPGMAASVQQGVNQQSVAAGSIAA